ncbi:sulfite exporter TauE/SafE family protein [Mycolicibacterium sp. S2-37]|uniref:sulfite exporter TauE/SafE family protein n=1 Tax=Mycolicibacterium sp. S2-37 TaxID=2810297 RepID=UPI001A94944C|nr:sulfite exporter TauE/SafE family protein [Mycolicibacterium sp. S2-37]MBO0677414.1 sulfite exporter TauE/SafE family protein [Mycolicibacterium sp. S2-37]
MTWQEGVFLIVAGVVGGLTGSIAGLASVATYPALLLVGLPPVAANVTNTVAVVFNGVGSIWGSLPELRGRSGWLKRIVPGAVLGGATGAVLLLSTPAEGFEKLVPVLIAVASVAILIPRRAPATSDDEPRSRWAAHAGVAAVFIVCIYGGYFGAAAGVLLLALLLRAGETMPHASADKNVILGTSNLTAAALFVFLAPVHWPAVLTLGVGCLVGSRLGPIVVRHSPAGPLRVVIGVAGLALAVELGLDAYR